MKLTVVSLFLCSVSLALNAVDRSGSKFERQWREVNWGEGVVLVPCAHFDYPLYSYDQVYDPLVCAVLKNNLWRAKRALQAGYNPHQRLAFGYSLRHVAYSVKMDELLKKYGVAPTKLVCYKQEVKQKGSVYTYITYPLVFGRDFRWRDVRGRYPEDYPLTKPRGQTGDPGLDIVPSRAELAQSLRQNKYHQSSKSQASARTSS